jgi:hypothetical protein
MNFMRCAQTKKPCSREQGFGTWKVAVSGGEDAHRLAIGRPVLGELDAPGDLREKRMVATDADIVSRMHLRAALANDDAPGWDDFAAERFDAEPL